MRRIDVAEHGNFCRSCRQAAGRKHVIRECTKTFLRDFFWKGRILEYTLPPDRPAGNTFHKFLSSVRHGNVNPCARLGARALIRAAVISE
jgi:hypothetical protein